MLTFAGGAGALAMKLTAAPILRVLGFRTALVVNTFVCTAFMASYGLFTPTTPHALIVATLLAGGFFRSLQFTSLNTLAYADVEEPAMSRATTLASVGQQLSLTFGVGLGALLARDAGVPREGCARAWRFRARVPCDRLRESPLARILPPTPARRGRGDERTQARRRGDRRGAPFGALKRAARQSRSASAEPADSSAMYRAHQYLA
jgi:hypothetical protein